MHHFNSIAGGEILSQIHNTDKLSVLLKPEYLSVQLKTKEFQIESLVQMRLLDNNWHTLEFLFKLGVLNIIIDKQVFTMANSTYNTAFITDQTFRNEAAVLILGKGYSGCLLHGPGFSFHNPVTVQAVQFGKCPLAPGPCLEHDVLVTEQVDHCINEPCMQHGTCTSQKDNYECHCAARYKGKNCETDLGPPCQSQPCLHGATCEEKHGDYTCHCAPGFTGVYCEKEIPSHPLCENNSCLNNSTCKVANDGTTIECECLKGFLGSHCEINANDCESLPCMNKGHCIDRVDAFICDCAGTGYSGILCENNIDECLSSPCANNGNCYDTYGSYICECMPGYGGQNCEQTINECQSQPCLHGGTCKNSRGNFECLCPSGYSGMFCENTPQCPNCPPDSECVNGRCICKTGTTGLYNVL